MVFLGRARPSRPAPPHRHRPDGNGAPVGQAAPGRVLWLMLPGLDLTQARDRIAVAGAPGPGGPARLGVSERVIRPRPAGAALAGLPVAPLPRRPHGQAALRDPGGGGAWSGPFVHDLERDRDRAEAATGDARFGAWAPVVGSPSMRRDPTGADLADPAARASRGLRLPVASGFVEREGARRPAGARRAASVGPALPADVPGARGALGGGRATRRPNPFGPPVSRRGVNGRGGRAAPSPRRGARASPGCGVDRQGARAR